MSKTFILQKQWLKPDLYDKNIFLKPGEKVEYIEGVGYKHAQGWIFSKEVVEDESLGWFKEENKVWINIVDKVRSPIQPGTGKEPIANWLKNQFDIIYKDTINKAIEDAFYAARLLKTISFPLSEDKHTYPTVISYMDSLKEKK